ncbi:MAG: triphosphoribosyl-dephospho-CoA synthase MdcB [Thiobacillus sp.]
MSGALAASRATLQATDWQALERLCIEALKLELDAWPKPGLVSPVDAGSHRDMNYATFLASLAALDGYFAAVAEAGAGGVAFAELQALGLAAEQRMLAATRGINTHRGAIFNLGLLAAAAGRRQRHAELADWSCGRIVAHHWGPAILAGRRSAPASHGVAVSRWFAVGGAREQAAAGFPAVYHLGLPVLHRLQALGMGIETALIGTLLALMAELPDTNLLWRGGEGGLAYTQAAAQRFNQAGSVSQPDWRESLLDLHRQLVRRNLSPGGSADLLAASWLAWQLERGRWP